MTNYARILILTLFLIMFAQSAYACIEKGIIIAKNDNCSAALMLYRNMENKWSNESYEESIKTICGFSTNETDTIRKLTYVFNSNIVEQTDEEYKAFVKKAKLQKLNIFKSKIVIPKSIERIGNWTTYVNKSRNYLFFTGLKRMC
jgi:hypothetical protein